MIRSDESVIEHYCGLSGLTIESGILVPDDIKAFITEGRFEVSRDGVEFVIRCPGCACRQLLASLAEQTFTRSVAVMPARLARRTTPGNES